jgi:hypothetical protein
MRGHRSLILLASLGLTACAGFVGFFVNQRDTIRAPHAKHLANDVECTTCHETILDSTNLDTDDRPKQKVCFGCHKEQEEKGECSYCHTQPEKPLTFLKRNRQLKMNHSEHIGRVKDDCTVCHKNLPNPEWNDHLAPSMATCLECHQKDWDEGNCALCHRDLSRYAIKPVAAFSHGVGFEKNHRLQARAQPETCATCHQQTFCSECHAKTNSPRIDVQLPERVDRSFIHRNDFLSRHPIEASADEATCQRCHGTDFCQSCHRQNGVVPGATNGLNPHPTGFGVGKAHGAAARQDIVACAACHDQGAGSNCVNCHRSGGPGGNPHPPSWLLRHGKEEIARNAMCQICHF